MTTSQLYLFNCFYLVVLVGVAFLTRASARRIAGALAGGAAFAVVALGIIALGEEAAWWHMVLTWEPYFITLLLVGFALCGSIHLVTWRIVRRFGGRGLVVVAIIAAIIGPPRDYFYMAKFPQWGAYAPGMAPVLVTAVSYAVMVLLGYGVMRAVAGPAGADRLARRPWEPADTPAPRNAGPLEPFK
ncbi:MAG TPA: hypothetical protein VMU04_10810 [Candidatus Acidoferrum sp.]|nr:hypothetical protein [Candidatus Acidoferrum sp.]